MMMEPGFVLEELGPIHGQRPVDLLPRKMLYNIPHEQRADLMETT